MKETKIENWEEVKKKLIEEFPDLIDKALINEIGKEEELLKWLQEKMKKKKYEIRKWLRMMG